MIMLAITLLLLLSALYFDLRYQRIPNKLCLAGLLAALALQAYISQWYGLGQALLGAGLALALLLPAFYFRFLGAGDVKLMIAVGALSGPTLLFWSLVYGIIFGTFTSLVLALHKLGWSGLLKMASQAFIKQSENQTSVFVPYAPALALGWLLACYLSPEIGAEIAPKIATLLSSINI
ncbi:A24 family peptidase [Colwellia sp. TT2012]|uniref:A24 family peptidase n=1 Tax=Colwellia sp. TT2012 TaxID=1720342 RepID=UPI00070E8DCA|nr:prepilin peptidase [Colwellia sp. TT2012]